MGIGIAEVVLLAIVAVPVGLVAGLTRHRWVLGVLAAFVVAAVATPPDGLSMLLVGLPLSGLYVLAGVALAWGRRLPRAFGEGDGPPQS